VGHSTKTKLVEKYHERNIPKFADYVVALHKKVVKAFVTGSTPSVVRQTFPEKSNMDATLVECVTIPMRLKKSIRGMVSVHTRRPKDSKWCPPGKTYNLHKVNFEVVERAFEILRPWYQEPQLE